MKLFCIALLPCVLYGAIFFNDDFEDSLLDGWSTTGDVHCAVDPEPNKWWEQEAINPDFVRIQYHGIVSMKIGTYSEPPGSAVHSFPTIPMPNEYMVEFYFHIYEGDENLFDNFYLYRPEIVDKEGMHDADIVLKLDSTYGDSVVLTVIDMEGTHSSVFFLKPDTIYDLDYSGLHYGIPNWGGVYPFPIERWYRFQIHKISGDKVVLYINGDSISTYTSLSLDEQPTRFFIGNAYPMSSGSGYYDDFIITTTPQGQHPRLLFNNTELPELRSRKEDNISTIQRTYQYYWDTIMSKSQGYNQNRTIWGLPFPYDEPPYSSLPFIQNWFGDSRANAETWHRSETIGLRWVVGELDPSNPPPDPSFFEYLRTMMRSFANWNHWNSPCEYRGLILKHPSRFEFCLTFGYDLLFDSLSNYEKMSIQNALLSQGIVPAYLLWRTRGWEDRWVPFYPGHPQWVSGMIGFMALVLDDDSLRNYYADFSETIVESLYIGAQETYMLPVFGPDGEFAHGSLQYAGVDLFFLAPFWEANRRVRGHNVFQSAFFANRFANYPLFRLYALCPGSSEDFRSGNSNFVTAGWHDAFCYITNQQNSFGQWFLKRLYSYYVDEFNRELNYRGLNFLFFDDEIVPQKPPFALGRNFGNFWVCMRTGLGDESQDNINDDNEVAMIFDTYGRKTLHIHQSRNNFVLGTNGSWIINETVGYMKNYWRSLLHNVIVVDHLWDPDPELPHTYDDEYGQRDTSLCTMQGFHNDDQYCFCANAVAEGCYVRMKKFVRKVIFTKDGYVVMKDEVESSHPNEPRKYLWLAQIPYDTPIYGDSLICDEDDKYQIKFLLPVGRQICSYHDVPLYGNTSLPYDVDGIYVANVEKTANTEFLSVIIARREGYQWPPSIVRIEGTTMVGADINNQSVILYDKGQTGNVNNVTYAINHAFPQGLNNILSGLKSEALYKVYINEGFIKSFATTDCGTGYFNIASTLSQNEIYVHFVGYLPKSGIASDVELDGKQPIALEIYPSLFRDITNIKLQVTYDCNAAIAIYDVSGRLVKTFTDLTNKLSKHIVIRWNGCDNTGTKLASGVYFLELHAGDYTETRKLLLIR